MNFCTGCQQYPVFCRCDNLTAADIKIIQEINKARNENKQLQVQLEAVQKIAAQACLMTPQTIYLDMAVKKENEVLHAKIKEQEAIIQEGCDNYHLKVATEDSSENRELRSEITKLKMIVQEDMDILGVVVEQGIKDLEELRVQLLKSEAQAAVYRNALKDCIPSSDIRSRTNGRFALVLDAGKEILAVVEAARKHLNLVRGLTAKGDIQLIEALAALDKKLAGKEE